MHGTSGKRNKVLVLRKAAEPVFRTFRSEVLFVVFVIIQQQIAIWHQVVTSMKKILTPFDMAYLFF